MILYFFFHVAKLCQAMVMTAITFSEKLSQNEDKTLTVIFGTRVL